MIHDNVGGDLFRIEAVNPYSKDHNAVVDQAKKELDNNARPNISNHVENMDSYDVIFIGYPNWWGTMPMPVFTFLEEYNFSGKTIIPFCTHEGSAMGRSKEDISKLSPNATVIDGLAVRHENVNKAQGYVKAWLQKIGMIN